MRLRLEHIVARSWLDQGQGWRQLSDLSTRLGACAAPAPYPRLAYKPWIVPIPGTINPAHLHENIAAHSVTLSPADVRQIEEGFAALGVTGMRAPEFYLARHDVGANLGSSSAGGHGMTPLPARSQRRPPTFINGDFHV